MLRETLGYIIQLLSITMRGTCNYKRKRFDVSAQIQINRRTDRITTPNYNNVMRIRHSINVSPHITTSYFDSTPFPSRVRALVRSYIAFLKGDTLSEIPNPDLQAAKSSRPSQEALVSFPQFEWDHQPSQKIMSSVSDYQTNIILPCKVYARRHILS